MSQTAIKSTQNNKSLNNDIVIQVTKKQLIKFLQFAVIMSMLTLNILAIKISSPFLKGLFVSQAILLLIYFIKSSNSNTIIK